MPPIENVVWDLTYACPLRCIHCYSESGRRPASTMSIVDARKVLVILSQLKPLHVSLAGGEPLLVDWWAEAASSLLHSGISVTVYTSGWLMNESIASQLASATSEVVVSIDGPNSEVHDSLRGRPNSFDKAMNAVEILDRLKARRLESKEQVYTLSIDYTVTRRGYDGLAGFVSEMGGRFPMLDEIHFGAVIPEGLAQEEDFSNEELLSEQQNEDLCASEARISAHAREGLHVSVTDVRSFLPMSRPDSAGAKMAHIEPDGGFRAFTTFEAKVGNILNDDPKVLWERALEWRSNPFVVQQIQTTQSFHEWARATQVLDQKFGSVADRDRIARRATVGKSNSSTDS